MLDELATVLGRGRQWEPWEGLWEKNLQCLGQSCLLCRSVHHGKLVGLLIASAFFQMYSLENCKVGSEA